MSGLQKRGGGGVAMTADVDEVLDFISGFDLTEAGWVHQASRCLLDGLGALLAGSRMPVARVAGNFALSHLPSTDKESCKLFAGGRADLLGAAIANGFASNALDIEHGSRAAQGRPGACLLPVMLALLETMPYAPTGHEFLTAFAIGYEIAIRAGIMRQKDPLNVPTSGSWASIGAVAAGGRLLGLSREVLLQALGCADFHSPVGLVMQSVKEPNMAKDGIGWGSYLAMSSLLLAQAGLSSPRPFHEMRHSGKFREILAFPPKGPFLMDGLYFKPYASCRWTHAAIDASLDLLKRYNLSSSDIDSVLVRTFSHAAALDRKAPSAPDEAEYNLTWALAAAMIDGRIMAKEVSPASFNDPRILEMQKRISIEIAPEFEKKFPKRLISEIIITADGKTYSSGPREARWEAGCPPTDQELEDKFVALCEPVCGREECRRLIDAVWGLDKARNCVGLLPKQ